MKSRILALAAVFAACFPAQALAHPHVMVDANLEVVRDAAGMVTELRNVWRFDELFSAMVIVDFDQNGNGVLEQPELDAVSATVTQSIGEQGWFTDARNGNEELDLVPPERIMVDLVDGQVLMFFAAKLKQPVSTVGDSFRVSISDPTYYVAMEIADESAVQITGNGAQCRADIYRPDFDKLLEENPDALTEEFFNDPKKASLSDQWMSWVTIKCAES